MLAARKTVTASSAENGLDALCRDLRRQLGAFGYQWLCACAVYPGLRFTLSDHLGRVLARALGRQPPDEDERAALFALPWFRTGWMPEEMRLRLIPDLVAEAVAPTRRAIEDLLLAAIDSPVATAPRQPLPLPDRPAGWRGRVRAFVETAPPDAVEYDAIFKLFMAGRRVHSRRVAHERRWRRRFGRRAAGWLGRRTAVAAIATALLTLAAFWQSDRLLGQQTETTWQETRQIETFRDCPECPEMVVIPAGTFLMGSPDDEPRRDTDESPQHAVTVGRFAAGRTEVTFAQWDACVAAGGCQNHKPDDRGWGRDQRPVINVSWTDAQAYAIWLSGKTGRTYRLLSESEWEYACRAGTTGPFHTGPTITTALANFDGNYIYSGGSKGEYRAKTVEVGGFPPNGFGLHEMHGNVWEWVEDCWHDSYQGAPGDGTAWTTGECERRVLRSGSWLDVPNHWRSADRVMKSPDFRFFTTGFRVARTITP